MFDRWTLPLVKTPLKRLARRLHARDIKADHVTLIGFLIGLSTLPLLAMEWYTAALVSIGLNRLADGLDGELARLNQPSDGGAFLDIVLDFIFYAAIIAGFALANPDTNALPAAFLLWGFMGTGGSFLAFAIMAERRELSNMVYPNKGFFYLGGIAEGTETIAFFVAMCLLPAYFPILAWMFFGLCVITTFTRVVGGYFTLRQST